MADVVDWNDAGGNQNRSKDGIRNLKLTSGNRYELRFVGHPIKFHKYFENGKSAIVKDPVDNAVKKLTGKDPGTRYAANVLLREATTSAGSPLAEYTAGQVYLMEFPQTVYNDVRDWGVARKADPGGKSGCNFSITITGQKKMTRYKTVGLDITPFTEPEKEYLRANVYDLPKLFKETADEDVLDKLGYKGGKPPEAQEEETVSAAPSSSVDLPF